MINLLSNFALSVIQTLGYSGLFFLSLIESCGIPIPSEIVLPFSGFLVATGQFGFWTAVILATLGNYAGSVILYWIGFSGGRWILDRYGRYVLIHKSDIEKGDRWFSKHGASATFFGRLLPLIRTFISLPAGVNRMNFKKFSLYTLVGSLPWNWVLIYAGVVAGKNWSYLHQYFHLFDIIIVVAVIAWLVWLLIRRRKHG